MWRARASILRDEEYHMTIVGAVGVKHIVNPKLVLPSLRRASKFLLPIEEARLARWNAKNILHNVLQDLN